MLGIVSILFGIATQYLSFFPALVLNLLFFGLTGALLWLAMPGCAVCCRSRVEAIGTAGLLGVLYIGAISLTLAMAGWFSGPTFFAAWMSGLAVLGLAAWRRRTLGSSLAAWRNAAPIPVWFWFLVFLWLVLYSRPFEAVIGGRDPGVYVNMAAGIAERGSIGGRDVFFAGLPASVQRQFVWCAYCPPGVIPSRFPGFLWIGGPNGSLGSDPGLVLPQFMPFYPSLMAPAYLLAGYSGALAILPLGFLLFALMLARLVPLLVGSLAAKFGESHWVWAWPPVLILLTPIMYWYGRMANADIFLGLFWFAAIAAWIQSAREAQQGSADRTLASQAHWMLAIASFGGALLTKIDTWLLVPAAIVALQVFHPHARSTFRWVQVSGWTVVAVLYLALTEWYVYPYILSTLRGDGIWLREFGHYALLMSALVLALITVFACVGPLLPPARWELLQSRTRRSLVPTQALVPGVILVLPILAILLVPRLRVPWQAWTVIASNISLPLLSLAAAGLIALVAPRVRWQALPVLVALVVNFLYTSRLFVSQDLVWDLRRTTSIVFPSLLLLTGVGTIAFLGWLAARWRGRMKREGLLFGLLLGALCLPLVVADTRVFTQDYMRGGREQLARFRGMFPANAVILSRGSQAANFFAPGLSTDGKRAVLEYYVSDDYPVFDPSVVNTVAQKAFAEGKPFFFISEDDRPPPTSEWQFEDYWRDTWLLGKANGLADSGDSGAAQNPISYRVYRALGPIVKGQPADPRAAVYEAESLPSAVGHLVADPTAGNGWARMAGPTLLSHDPYGALVYGPYTELPAGDYLARFWLRVSGPSPTKPDKLEVLGPSAEESGRPRVLASQPITIGIASYTAVDLPFTLAAPTRVEYSVHYDGQSQVWLDRVDVLRAHGQQ